MNIYQKNHNLLLQQNLEQNLEFIFQEPVCEI